MENCNERFTRCVKPLLSFAKQNLNDKSKLNKSNTENCLKWSGASFKKLFLIYTELTIWKKYCAVQLKCKNKNVKMLWTAGLILR